MRWKEIARSRLDEINALEAKLGVARKKSAKVRKAIRDILAYVEDVDIHAEIPHTHAEYTDECTACQVQEMCLFSIKGEWVPRP